MDHLSISRSFDCGELNCHNNEQHKVPESDFECSACLKTFRSERLLQKHEKLYHTEEGKELLSTLSRGNFQ